MPQNNADNCSGSISAVALVTMDMAVSVAFYRALGFELTYGGDEALFSSLQFGQCFVNLSLGNLEVPLPWWGRVIFHVPDVDAVYSLAVMNGFDVEAEPNDAPWGERYFHVLDPMGHQLSFAKPL